ncbi:MAG: hypothetical protein FJ100_23555, partial [Deltaproteobacteria bacterium]|nr:hypothetical protein [Deltaproteobacteria bacterium]
MRPRRATALLALVATLSCSGPAAWHRDADLDRLAVELPAHLSDPERAAEARRQLAWLCLLHDRACPQAFAAVGEGDASGADQEAALLHALLRDGHPDAARSARAWLDAA